MSTKTQAKPLFAATLTPHRSLTPGGKRLVIGLVVAMALVPGIIFYLAGAWPVVGFIGARRPRHRGGDHDLDARRQGL